MLIDDNTAASFWSKVNKDGPTMAHMETPCWVWTGSRSSRGYGHAYVDRVGFRAHRLAFILSGGEVGEGTEVCHACDNPPCVRPDHLWIGTHTDNMRDAASKGRLVHVRGDAHWSRTQPERLMRGDMHTSKRHPEKLLRGTDHPLASVDDATVIHIWTSADPAVTISVRYGVSRNVVQHIRAGNGWQHITNSLGPQPDRSANIRAMRVVTARLVGMTDTALIDHIEAGTICATLLHGLPPTPGWDVRVELPRMVRMRLDKCETGPEGRVRADAAALAHNFAYLDGDTIVTPPENA